MGSKRLPGSELLRDYVTKNKLQVIARPAPSNEARRAVQLLQKISNNICYLLFICDKASLAGSISDEYLAELTKKISQFNMLILNQANWIKHDH